MNWGEIGTQIILGVAGVIVSSLGIFITYLVNKYVKDQQLKRFINDLNELVKRCVLETYQTYVEELKDKDLFNKDAQRIALNHCLELIKANMPKELETWLKENYSNVESYLKSLVEANIGLLKANAK